METFQFNRANWFSCSRRPLLCARVLSLHQPDGLLSQSYLQPYFSPPRTEFQNPTRLRNLDVHPSSNENKSEDVTCLCASLQAVCKGWVATNNKVVLIIIIM